MTLATRGVRIRHQGVRLAVDYPVQVRRSGELKVAIPAQIDPADAHLLQWDPSLGAYRPVLLPPGSSWQLVTDEPAATLWRPR